MNCILEKRNGIDERDLNGIDRYTVMCTCILNNMYIALILDFGKKA